MKAAGRGARSVWVFGSDALLAALRAAGLRRARPLGWAGMRGVVTLAVDQVLHDLERDLDLEEMGVIFQRG